MQANSEAENTDSLYKVDENLMVVEEHGTIYLIPPLAAPQRLNLSASVIWRLLTRHSNLTSIKSAYVSKFNCNEEEAAEDIEGFARQMLNNNFLHLRDNIRNDKSAG